MSETNTVHPDAIIEVETWPKVVKLRHPVEFGNDGTITELTFRRGTFGDVKGIKLGEAIPLEHIMLLASRLCGRAIGLIERLDSEDAGEVSEIAMLFLGRCLPGSRGASR